MTTLTIDDELGQRARRAAAAQGKSLDEFVREALQQAVGAVTISLSARNGLPVIEVHPPLAIDPAEVQRALQEDGF
jgi:plasmid stability protein